MKDVQIVLESKPVNVSHDTYRRECRYTRGIHIPLKDFEQILNDMPQDIRLYFEFHNPGKPIQQEILLNGYSGLAKAIANYYLDKNGSIVSSINNGQDFYVKII